MAVFDGLAKGRFDRWLTVHVHTHWPDRVAHIDDPVRLTRVLDDALARAKEFGIHDSRNLVRYVNLLMLLGIDFASDDRIPWVGELLRAETFDEEDTLDAIFNILAEKELDQPPLSWGWP